MQKIASALSSLLVVSLQVVGISNIISSKSSFCLPVSYFLQKLNDNAYFNLCKMNHLAGSINMPVRYVLQCNLCQFVKCMVAVHDMWYLLHQCCVVELLRSGPKHGTFGPGDHIPHDYFLALGSHLALIFFSLSGLLCHIHPGNMCMNVFHVVCVSFSSS